MDHNPFISRNNDLFIMLTAGAGIHFANTYLTPMSVQLQFLLVLLFSICAGLLLNYLYQRLEWALFLILGIQAVALAPYLIDFAINGHFSLIHIIHSSFTTGKYSFFLLSSWIVGIPTGYIIQKLFMANYYRRSHF